MAKKKTIPPLSVAAGMEAGTDDRTPDVNIAEEKTPFDLAKELNDVVSTWSDTYVISGSALEFVKVQSQAIVDSLDEGAEQQEGDEVADKLETY